MPGIQHQTAINVGGKRSEGEEQQAQQTNLLAAPEFSPRQKLIQQFLHQLGHWSEVLSAHDNDILLRQYGEEYVVIPKEQWREIEPALRITGRPLMITSDKTEREIRYRSYQITVLCLPLGETKPLTDPYTNRILQQLRITIDDTPYDTGYHSRYYLDIEMDQSYDMKTGKSIDEGVRYYMPRQRGEETSDVDEKQTPIYTERLKRLNRSDDPELLSGDIDAHARAIFDLVDSVISYITPQPERRATPELSAPKQLPAPRRTPTR